MEGLVDIVAHERIEVKNEAFKTFAHGNFAFLLINRPKIGVQKNLGVFHNICIFVHIQI